MGAETLIEFLIMITRSGRALFHNNNVTKLIICENETHAKKEFDSDLDLLKKYITNKNNESKAIEFESGVTYYYISKDQRLNGIVATSYEIRTNIIVEELFDTIRRLRNDIFELKKRVK